MTNPEPLDLLDTDYATLIATDCDPNLERLLTGVGSAPGCGTADPVGGTRSETAGDRGRLAGV
ncbi:MAG: hypothetical protein ACRCU2_08500 [Planktothrix sp.]